ncbi:hypothetical protein HYH03_018959 [Edaphochlamys debaryana]|uniref:phytol kinase n=1 Tax=Edaphochlamys debaryana TaxID=47281 RepID=A0A835XEW5_9CHLO|nr:hypothetical protein HYH03_018959 [Edaphochlamys debaryana]|eukprot:KAG2482084.1 hypothetical protein HYH03_018959 [Edaphochlamys debaryana]
MATLGPELEAATHAFIARAEVLLPAVQTDGDGLPPAPTALEDIGDSLRALVKGMPPLAEGQRARQFAAALADWPGFQSALLHTLAVVSRIKLEGPATEVEEEARRETGVAMRIMVTCVTVCQRTLVSLGAAVPGPSTSPEPTRLNLAVVDFPRRLLRTETLQALAARLAEVRQATTAAAAAAVECYRSELAAALRSSYISEHIAATTLALLQAYSESRDLLSPEISGPRDQLLQAVSNCTHAMLRLAAEPAASATAAPGPSLCVSASVAPSLPASSPGQQHTSPLCVLRSAAALGPCASYLTLAYGMSVLSYMDGGGTRGLPEDVARALGELVRSGARARLHELASSPDEGVVISALRKVGPIARAAGQGSVASAPQRLQAVRLTMAVQNLCNGLRVAALAACAASSAARSAGSPFPTAVVADAAAIAPAATSASPPRRLQLGWHTALGLAMRAARMGVRAAEEAAAGRTREQEVTALMAALEDRGTFRELFGEELAAAVAVGALKVTAQLRSLLPAASGADATGGSVQADQGAEWWRLMAAVAPCVGTMKMMDLFSAQGFGDCLRMHLPRMPRSADPLPPLTPPALASALAGGVLPCLERLIRRAAAAATGDAGAGQVTPEFLVLVSFEKASWTFVDSMNATWGWLAPLLAYGDPREAGALIASLGKALAGFDSASRGLNALLNDFTSNLCTVAPTWLDGAAARLVRGGALSPPERQLAGLLGAAAAAWLPEASRRIWSGLSRTQAGFVDCLMPLGCVSAGLRWLPLLSCAAAPTAGDAAAAAALPGMGTPATNVAETSSGGGGGGGGWGCFTEALFPRQVFIPLAVGIQQRANSDDGSRQALAPWTAEAACTFAALRPQEAAAAAAGSVLQIEQLRALTSELKAGGQAEAADAAEALAAQLVRWERGGGARGGGRGGGRAGAAASAAPLAARYGVWIPRLQSAAALLPASPAAARQLLGGCSNPACANLEGDSDVALPLRACAGCGGAASYCSRECQTAHWRSGHREACRGGAGGGGRGGGG